MSILSEIKSEMNASTIEMITRKAIDRALYNQKHLHIHNLDAIISIKEFKDDSKENLNYLQYLNREINKEFGKQLASIFAKKIVENKIPQIIMDFMKTKEFKDELLSLDDSTRAGFEEQIETIIKEGELI